MDLGQNVGWGHDGDAAEGSEEARLRQQLRRWGLEPAARFQQRRSSSPGSELHLSSDVEVISPVGAPQPELQVPLPADAPPWQPPQQPEREPAGEQPPQEEPHAEVQVQQEGQEEQVEGQEDLPAPVRRQGRHAQQGVDEVQPPPQQSGRVLRPRTTGGSQPAQVAPGALGGSGERWGKGKQRGRPERAEEEQGEPSSRSQASQLSLVPAADAGQQTSVVLRLPGHYKLGKGMGACVLACPAEALLAAAAELDAPDAPCRLPGFRSTNMDVEAPPAHWCCEGDEGAPYSKSHAPALNWVLFKHLNTSKVIKAIDFAKLNLIDGPLPGQLGSIYEDTGEGVQLVAGMHAVHAVALLGPDTTAQAARLQLFDCPVWVTRSQKKCGEKCGTKGNNQPILVLRCSKEWRARADRRQRFAELLFYLKDFQAAHCDSIRTILFSKVGELAGEAAAAELKQQKEFTLQLAEFGVLGEDAAGELVWVTRPLLLEVAAGAYRRVWGPPVVQPSLPSLPWFLSSEPPADEDLKELWDRRMPFAAKAANMSEVVG